VAAWRALLQPEWLDRIYLPYDRLLARGRFVRDRAGAVDGRRVTLASGDELLPDYLVLATGSHYPFPAKSDDADLDAARARVRAAHDALMAASRALIVGAGPAGLELAGEIRAFAPAVHVTIVDMADEILAGPYDQALRDELRRQLDALGVELQLGVSLRELPSAPPATRAPIRIATAAGEAIEADIWFRAFGVRPQAGYLEGGSLADRRDPRGYVRVDRHLRVAGEERVFAVGDISDADRDMAGIAGVQARLAAGNLRALITGEGELASYEPFPALIAVPLGPEGGAGSLGDGREAIAEIKGRDMLVDAYAAMFDAGRALSSR
jgi:NADH dehydrogenase FAD-containing subunit